MNYYRIPHRLVCLVSPGIVLFLCSVLVPTKTLAQISPEAFTVSYYRDLLSKIPQNSTDYSRVKLNMGVAMTVEGNWEGARDIFLELRTSPNNIEAIHNLVLIDLVLGNKDDAKEGIESLRDVGSGNLGASLDKLVELPPDEVQAMIYRGAITNNSQNWRAHARLGAILAKLGRYAEAKDSYMKAIELNQNESDLHNALGESYGKLGQLDKALESLQKAITLDPGFSKAYTNIGVIYGKMGKFSEGTVALNHASLLGSRDPMTYYALGQCYILTGHKDSAMTAYDKLKSLDAAMADKLKKRIEQ